MTTDTSMLPAWSLFLDAHLALMRRLQAEMQQEVGISFSWFGVLVTLVTAPHHQLRMGEVAESIGQVLSFSRVSRLVGELASNDLVERITDPDDGRAVIVRLLPAGHEVHRKAAKIHMRGVRQYFGAHVSEQQHRLLMSTFEGVLAALGTQPSPLRPWKETSHPKSAEDA
jgi:DNA-binding MarR family transcriptional regulator